MLVVYPHCSGNCIGKREDGTDTVCSSLSLCIEKAKQEWLDTRAMFNEVTEKENIDAVIYKMEACERKYAYLLQLARRENLKGYPHVKG